MNNTVSGCKYGTKNTCFAASEQTKPIVSGQFLPWPFFCPNKRKNIPTVY